MTAEGGHHGTSGDHGHHSTSRVRMLFGAPVLLQDWDKESEHVFQYWELFLDLLLVAAASAVTDQFKEDLSLHGLGQFVVFFSILMNGWYLYTHHITSRYHDNSLAHSMVLFFYILGFGLAMVNTGYHDVQACCWGAILQRASVVLMCTWLSCTIPRSKYTNAAVCTITITTMALLLIVALWGEKIEESPVIMAALWTAAVVEFLGELFMSPLVEGRRMVPVNIEQCKERLGALVLSCLGETVLSVTVIYREMLSKGEIGGHRSEEGEAEEHVSSGSRTPIHDYYLVLGSSFLLIYMFLLLYFHLQPSPADHALRRSRWHGLGILVLHKVLGLTILVVGVSVKLVVECLLAHEELPTFASQLMGYGVGGSLLVLFAMRRLHYGGRESVNIDTLVFRYGDDHRLDQIATIWWWTYGLAGFVPLVGVFTGFTTNYIEDPLVLTAAHAGLVFLLVVAETCFVNALQDQLLIRHENALAGGGEHAALTKQPLDYDACKE